MLAYFGLTLFVSATLLFLVQPMIGKMILPQLGGTPAVWNTCMVFFQGVLLFGYGYTHLLTTTQTTRRQVLIQCVLLFLPFAVLPFSIGEWMPETNSNPIFSLLGKLIVMVGLPFLVVSTTAPLMQKWFQHTGHPAAKDPYFLYGASNFGSMLGLALYPTLVEPLLPVTPTVEDGPFISQVHLWTAGYALFVALVIGSAVIVWQALAKVDPPLAEIDPLQKSTPGTDTATAIRSIPPSPEAAPTVTSKSRRNRAARFEAPAPSPDIRIENTDPVKDMPWVVRFFWWWQVESGIKAVHQVESAYYEAKLDRIGQDNITLWRRLRWIGLAAAPSSLMLGVTTYMTTDIAAVAFFWIVPLALYLLTFICVFARWPVVWTGAPHTVVLFIQPMFLLGLAIKMIANISIPSYDTPLTFGLHLASFFLTTLMCHGELAKDRPSVKYLTEFYFWMSLGGVLGGLFNALVAPFIFQSGIWEYPVAMILACLLRPNMADEDKTLIRGDSTARRPTVLGYVLDTIVPLFIAGLAYGTCYVADNYAHHGTLVQRKFGIAALAIASLALCLRPLRFGFAVAALFLGSGFYDWSNDELVAESRGFFGLLRVRATNGAWYRLPVMEEGDRPMREYKIYRTLIHGGINHGRQIVDYKEDNAQESDALKMIKRREPITYFYDRNGVAEVYHKLCWPKVHMPSARWPAAVVYHADLRLPASMIGLAAGANAPFAMLANTQSEPPYAVLGLGTGLLACYAKPYQHVDFYEIDPLVKNMSIVPGYVPPWHPDRAKMPKLKDPIFYFVHDAQERYAKIDVILGDGRLKIKEAPENYYHVISLDAFSSDAIPTHLLTAEAVEVYMSKLAEGGVLLFNTTNRYVRIEPVLAAIAEAKGYDCLYCPDYTYDEDHPDRYSADWVVLQRRIDKESYRNGGLPIQERLEKERVRRWWNGIPVRNNEGKIITEDRWRTVDPLPGPIWTDGHSNLLKIMRWR